MIRYRGGVVSIRIRGCCIWFDEVWYNVINGATKYKYRT